MIRNPLLYLRDEECKIKQSGDHLWNHFIGVSIIVTF